MKISRIDAIPVTIPIQSQLIVRGARGAHDRSPFVIIRVHTDQGIIGLGEVSCTPIWSGEDQVTAKHFVDQLLSPALVGQSPLEIERISTTMDRLLASNPFTKAGIEVACWDIMGKVAGLPLYRFWGGGVRKTVPIKFSISGGSPTHAASLAERALQMGFRAMKVKVGMNLNEDVQRVRAVLQVVGSDVLLGVDANGGYSVRQAVELSERLSDANLSFFEQPVAPGDPMRMAEVRQRCHLPILADESVNTPEDALALVRHGAADAFSTYVGKGAGVGAVQRIGVIARAAGLGCTLGSNLELGIASAAMIHLAAGTFDQTCDAFPPDILGPLYYEADILAEPLDLQGGRAAVPTAPGLGVELDDEALAKFRID